MRSKEMPRHASSRGIRLLLAPLATLCLALCLSPSALATVFVHPFVRAVGPDGTESTHFRNNLAIAVDPASHDVYLADFNEPKLGRLYRFTSSGAPDNYTAGAGAGKNYIPKLGLSLASSIAIAPPGAAGGTAGDVYLADNDSTISNDRGRVLIFSPSGELLGKIEPPSDGNPYPHEEQGLYARICCVATDPAGNVYVGYITVDGVSNRGEPSQAHIDKYVPSGNPLSPLDFDSEVTGIDPNKLSADSNYLYLGRLSLGSGNAKRLPLSAFPGGNGTAEVSGGVETVPVEQVLVATKPTVVEAYVQGVAVDPGLANAYISNWPLSVSDPTSQLRIYGPPVPVEPPTAATNPASNVTYQSAEVTGTVNAGGSGSGHETTYVWECHPGCSSSGSAEIPTDGQDHEVKETLRGLAPSTQYEVTLVATNLAGEAKSTTTFETLAKPVVNPPQVTIATPTEITATGAHLSGTVDPGGTGEEQKTTYRFEYLNGLEWVQLETQGPIVGSGPQEVSAELEGLEPITSYSVRLVAENLGGSATSPTPDPSFTTEPAPPAVEATAASHVGPTAAQINARVQPHLLTTTYYFEWGTGSCEAGGCASVPVNMDGEAGEGDTFVYVDAKLQGLSPATAYRYRLIAENSQGKTVSPEVSFETSAPPSACSNANLRNGASANLPDCRAYEMVSPVEKNGGDILASPRRSRVARDGNAVSYVARTAFAGSRTVNERGAEYVSRREAGGWGTAPISLPAESLAVPSLYAGSDFVGGFSPDLSAGVFRGLGPVPGLTTPNVWNVSNLYLGTGLGGPSPRYQLLSDSETPLPSDRVENSAYAPHIQFAGASEDFSHVLFESSDNLTPDAAGSSNKLYEWVQGKGTELAGILPDNACGSPPCAAPTSAAGQGAQELTGTIANEGAYTQEENVISADGSRVFFSSEGAIYMREDGTSTIRIDESERTNPTPGDPGTSSFQWATPDGREVFFISTRDLTNEDNQNSGLDHPQPRDLYRYDTEAPAGERLTRLTPPRAWSHESYSNLYEVVGVSNNGQKVYFEGQISPSQVRRLYLWRGGEIREVGHTEPVSTGNSDNQTSWGSRGGTRSVRHLQISPDGRYVLFATNEDQGLGLEMHGQGGVAIFLYDSASGEVSCVSCDAAGKVLAGYPNWYASMAFNELAMQFNPQPMSDDGRHVFFDSANALVPSDTNGKLDVYEYDTETGKPALISSGQCNCDSFFDGASPNGGDVFFTTREQLVRSDQDNIYDLYDARVGGGIAAQQEAPPVGCEGDACQAPVSPPVDSTPGSSSFAGAGNQKPRTKHRRKHRHRRSHHRHHHGRRG